MITRIEELLQNNAMFVAEQLQQDGNYFDKRSTAMPPSGRSASSTTGSSARTPWTRPPPCLRDDGRWTVSKTPRARLFRRRRRLPFHSAIRPGHQRVRGTRCRRNDAKRSPFNQPRRISHVDIATRSRSRDPHHPACQPAVARRRGACPRRRMPAGQGRQQSASGRSHRPRRRDGNGARVDRPLEGKRQAARAPAALPAHGDPARWRRAAALATPTARR